MKYAIINPAIWLIMVATAYFLDVPSIAIITMAIGWTAGTISAGIAANKIWGKAFK